MRRVEAPGSSQYITVSLERKRKKAGERERERRGEGISGYTFSSHCAVLKGVQWPWSESRIVSTALDGTVLRLSLAAASVSISLPPTVLEYSLSDLSIRLRVNERGVPFWCYSWTTDGASAPGPLNPRKPLEISRNPAPATHIMVRNNFKAPY